MAPLIRGNSLYKFIDADTWQKSRDQSINLGGNLITLNTKEEYKWASNNIWNSETINTWFFTGFNDATEEGKYEWTSGENSSSPTNLTDFIHRQNWDYQQQHFGAWDYGIVSFGNQTGGWGDNGFRDAGKPDDDPYGNIVLVDNDASFYKSSGDWQIKGIAEIPLTSSITFSSTPKEGAGVFTTYINLSAGTEDSGNLAEGATVYWKVTGIDADDLESGELSGSGTITEGKFDLQHALKRDSDTGESFEVALFSDAEMTQQIGSMKTSAIQEENPADTKKPILHSLSVTPQWSDDPSETRQVVIEGKFTDDISGLHIAHGSPVIEWWSPSGQRYGTHLHTLISGSNLDGLYSGSFELSQYAESGAWKLMRLEYQDNAGNSISHNRETLSALGISTDFEINNPLSDNSAPVVHSITLNPKWSPDPSEPRVLEIEARFTDDGSGLHIAHGSPVIEWWSPSGRNYGTHLHTLQSGSNTDGVYVGTISLPEDADQGIWTLGRLEFSDNARNSISHNRDSLLQQGIETDFHVNQPHALSIPTLQSTTASKNHLTLTFSEDLQVAGGGALNTSFLSVTVDGRKRRIRRAQINPENGSEVLINVSGRSLIYASSLDVAYDPSGAQSNNGGIESTSGTAVEAIASYSVETYSTPTNTRTRGISEIYKNLILTGNAIRGSGNAKDNTITGNDANNTLDGLAGVDTMIGKGGNDTYIIDNEGDVVIELESEGTDTVESSITYTLGDHVENLTLLGRGSINGTGNSANNTITGNYGANVLDGNGGADMLIGGRGNDTYIVDSSDDQINENGWSFDIDTVIASIDWSLGAKIENLTLKGTGAINGTGNSLDNTIVGNDANNILDGGVGGKDILTGQGGADTFVFSSRPRRFRNYQADHITDFSSAEGDKIQITKRAFGIKGETATLSVVSGKSAVTGALSTASMFIYDTSSGELHWNQNGTWRGDGIGGVLAVLDNRTTLSASDLVLV